ncbi:MAG: DNA/RNA non-specific endonuclease [Acidobacteria bacterium]|nr:DNA/RNA non-specific endonuclease [Acidobacteriota bacterium]
MNLSVWRRIENDIRKLAAQSDALYILTGALFDCGNIQHIGRNQIAVPCATYKVILSTKGDTKSAYAVILPNQPGATGQTVSIREVEARTSLDFLSAIPSARTEPTRINHHSPPLSRKCPSHLGSSEFIGVHP